MQAKASSVPPRRRRRTERSTPKPRPPRGPVFPLSRAEIIQRCREKPHDMLCAGEALALMDLMSRFHLTIKGLHESSGVTRSMIRDLLTMEAVMTNDTVGKLARAFELETIEFHLLGFYTLRAEVTP
ncbi:MAG: hypothetical protein R3F13_19545 [Prosthecobacter sp.]